MRKCAKRQIFRAKLPYVAVAWLPDFEKMYFELFNGVTDIIEELKVLQQKAEKLYVDGTSEEAKKVN